MRISGICGQCSKYYKGEQCPKCDEINHQSAPNVILDVPGHFNRGLGEYVFGRRDYREKLRAKGMTEVGNEKKYVDPEYERRQKEREQDKAREQLRPRAYQMLGNPQWN